MGFATLVAAISTNTGSATTGGKVQLITVLRLTAANQ